MAVKGVFASDRHIVGNRRGDFATAVLQVFPQGTAPLFALTSGMHSRDANDTVITWFEENKVSGRILVTNNATTGTSLVVDDATTTVAGDIYMIETTGEFVYVASVSGSTLTVDRGFAGTTNTSINGSVTPVAIQKIGTAFEEGSARPTSVVNLGSPKFNYTQIFRNAWDITGTAQAVDYMVQDVPAKNKADCAFFHAEAIEKSLMFGRKSIGIKNTKPFRTMDGILTQITTNVTAVSTPVSWSDMNLFLMSIYARNIKGKPNERIAFCGNQALLVVNDIAINYGFMQLKPGETEFGMKITKWITPFGDISLMTHPLMVESPLWTKDLYVLHPGAIEVRYLRRTRERTYEASVGDDADFGTLTTELSCSYGAELTGGKMTGITEADKPVWYTEEQA